MPTLVFAVIAIGGSFLWAVQADPFFSFGAFIMPFVGALGALGYMFVMTRATFSDEYFKVQRISVCYRDVVEITRGTFSLIVMYQVKTGSGAIRTRKVKLPFLEMREDDRKRCLEIFRQRAPGAFKSEITA
ncbi:hypothetical protein [Burkholderia metallica]|uniref:hypothetical protein n=1 Tax=Burkholderia metallica TaxID=488729 RepID=UPI001575EF31|nr:hypothetical protein [Burkholderia metallica]NTZ09049.1 hypothetical protein [Burkholderia metallica]